MEETVKKTAYQIAHKKRISGLVTAGEKAGSADWFKFKLAKNRKVKIELAKQSVPMHFDSIFTDRVAEMEYAWLP